jgi:HAD superfamily hydrolase (TIGR01509 family)
MYFNTPSLAAALEKADVVVFDMNGTIVDDEPVHHEAANEVLSPFGLSLDEDAFIARCIGIRTRNWMSALLPQVPPEDLGALAGKKEAAYARLVADKVRGLVRPGALNLIHFAAEHPDKKLALATSSPRDALSVILGPSGLGVIQLFDFIITGNDVTNVKPHPEIYHRVRAAFPGAENFLVIEDTFAGVTAAKAAGMTCLAFPNAYTIRQDLTAADAAVDSLLPDALAA